MLCLRTVLLAGVLAFGATGQALAVEGALEVGPVAMTVPADAHVLRNARELQEALAADSGPAVLWLAAGVYRGNFVVRRSLTLRGERGAVLDGEGRGTVLTIEADDAEIDNLTLRNSGRRNTAEDAGVRAKGLRIQLRHLRVEESLFGITLGPCRGCGVDYAHVRGAGANTELQGDGIKLWESDHARVRDCLVENMRDVVVWYSRHVLLERNVVRNSRYGTHFMYAHDSVVRDSRITNNVVGVFVMYSRRLHVIGNVLAGAKGAAGIGIGFKDSDGIDVKDNWFIANTTGTYLDVTPRGGSPLARFEDNVFAINQVALRLHARASDIAFTRNQFQNNGSLIDVEGGGDALAVDFEHNYYSDYAGYDLDHDGFGDVAHQVKRLSAAWIDSHPVLALFEGSAALGLLDVIAAAAPVFANKLMLVDSAPLFERPWRQP